jgi:hypothetical protein
MTQLTQFRPFAPGAGMPYGPFVHVPAAAGVHLVGPQTQFRTFGPGCGMRYGPFVHTAVVASRLTIRERVLRNLVATLETIRAVDGPFPGADNTSVGAVVSGTYLGDVTRRYTVTVTSAGISGVAVCTVVDSLGLDGSGGGVITSGDPLTIGTLGVSLTITFTGALKVGDVWDIWAGPYETSIQAVFRQDDVRKLVRPEDNYIVLGKALENSEEIPLGKRSWHMVVPLACFLQRSDDTAISAALGDILKVLMIDYTRGGYAIDTDILSNVSYAMEIAKTESGFDLMVEIHYRHNRDDPTQL